jgi:uncharacterized membrane protein
MDLVKNEQEELSYIKWLERRSFRIALVSTFTALSIVIGYLLAYLPNIELFTLMIFLSGFILGKRDGIIVGFLSSFIFCFFNPLGASPLPLLTFQLIHYSLTGLVGALIRNYFQLKIEINSDNDYYKFSIMIMFGFIGAFITLSFQIFSSLVDIFSYYGNLDQFLPYFLSGIGFTVIHIVGNTLSFVFILPGLIQIINKMLHIETKK